MNSVASDSPGQPSADSLPNRELLASRRHTFIFISICIGVSALSALNATHGAPRSANEMLQVYLWLIGLEWLWVRFVYKGMQATGHSMLEFIGRQWLTPRQLMGDLVYAILALGFSYVLFVGSQRLLSHSEAVSNPLLPTVPSGVGGTFVWIGLSLSAGICEEIVFRGYLQRQLGALTRSTRVAIIGQAILFGAAHGYEGVGAVVRIVVYGLAIGVLAQWRGNIRAGVYAHAAWDILEGLRLI
jgi:uncharacterized protein